MQFADVAVTSGFVPKFNTMVDLMAYVDTPRPMRIRKPTLDGPKVRRNSGPDGRQKRDPEGQKTKTGGGKNGRQTAGQRNINNHTVNKPE